MPASSILLWGVRFSSTTYNLRVTCNSITETLPFPASGSLSVTKDYFPSGDDDGSTDLLQMLEACIEAHTQAPAVDIALTEDFFIQITSSVAIELVWQDAATTLDGAPFGWTADSGSATTLTGDYIPHGIWRPQRPIARDSRLRQPIVGGVSKSVSGKTRVSRIAEPEKTRELSWIFLPKDRVLSEYATAVTGVTSTSFEYAWINSISKGYAFRYYADEASLTSPVNYRIADLADPIARSEQFQIYWDIAISATEDSSL